MSYYAGLDVSDDTTSVCVIDAGGEVAWERKVASEPSALVEVLEELGDALLVVGMEAGALSPWLAVILHRMWVDGTTFRLETTPKATAAN